MPCTSNFQQPFPRTGHLKANLNLSLGSLRKKIDDSRARVYSYIVSTVKNRGGTFVQTGSAPNFQGDVISLCTCKHFMRSFCDLNAWPGAWIAGYTGNEVGDGRNALIYLMKVRFAFESHHDLWFSEELPDSVKQAKLATMTKFGDVFEPMKKLAGKEVFNPQNYRKPEDHVHLPKNGWHKDIHYEKGMSGRKAALLIGDAKYSFLWNKPLLFHSKQLHRGQRKDNLRFMLDLLQQ